MRCHYMLQGCIINFLHVANHCEYHMQYHADTMGSNHQPCPSEFFVLPCFELQKQQHAACCSIISVGI